MEKIFTAEYREYHLFILHEEELDTLILAVENLLANVPVTDEKLTHSVQCLLDELYSASPTAPMTDKEVAEYVDSLRENHLEF